MIKSTYRLQGRPSDRLLLIHICGREGATFTSYIDGSCTVKSPTIQMARRIREQFDAVIAFATIKLGLTRSDPKFARYNTRTIDSFFMMGFVDEVTDQRLRRVSDPIIRRGVMAGAEWLKNSH